MNYLSISAITVSFIMLSACVDLSSPVSRQEMEAVFQEVRTPYKQGMVVTPDNPEYMSDSPSVFRYAGRWYMTWIVFDGKGYETWISESENLLNWTTLGKVLSYTSDGWDRFQRAGYAALQDTEWGGSYELGRYRGRYWMSYLGGCKPGYETEPLMVGLASTDRLGEATEWRAEPAPVLSPLDPDSQWFEKRTQYKSTIIRDRKRITGHRFVMYYNAKGENPENGLIAERIGMAFSEDIHHWTRFEGNPVLAHESSRTITGDPQIQKIGDIYVMFYFRAFDPDRPYKAYNTFACSRDLVHWYDWEGEDLIFPSEPYDNLFAHKSHVVRWNGVTYHFYCAVNDRNQRGIAVATSEPVSGCGLR